MPQPATGGRPDRLTAALAAAARRRLSRYRVYLYLIMWVEAVPRRYGQVRLDWLRERVFQPLAATLDDWSRDR